MSTASAIGTTGRPWTSPEVDAVVVGDRLLNGATSQDAVRYGVTR